MVGQLADQLIQQAGHPQAPIRHSQVGSHVHWARDGRDPSVASICVRPPGSPQRVLFCLPRHLHVPMHDCKVQYGLTMVEQRRVRRVDQRA